MLFDALREDVPNRGVVRDADGFLIPYPIRGDTETGVVECYAMNSDGSYRLTPDGCPMIVERTYKAPLVLEPVPDVKNLQQWTDNQPSARPML